MKKITLGHMALGFPHEGGQPKCDVALGLLPLRYNPSVSWRLAWALSGTAQGQRWA